MRKNVWLLTEERPKRSVIQTILVRFCAEFDFKYSANDVKILPIINKNGNFGFCYRVTGFESDEIKDIYILPVSGYSSFVDFMLFYQDDKPTDNDKPLLLIEETKTDDKESRNTGVYQRCSKFVFTEFFYPDNKKIMFYNLQVGQKEKPTLTYIFGTRMLMTLGVEIIGKELDPNIFQPFNNLDEMIDLKNSMPNPNYGVPVKFKKTSDVIYISAKLEKSGRLSHDPNIGMTSIMSACLRKLGWKGRIVITKHGLSGQASIGNKNKFNFIAHQHGIELEGLSLPKVVLPEQYWKTETEKEKTGTIFVHVICENLVSGVSVYENHGGCERGYFYDYSSKEPLPITIPKYTDKQKYKAGDKTYIIYIPDLVLYDKARNEIINIEGKTYANRAKGVIELNNYDFFDDNYIKPHYKNAKITRSLVLAGTGSSNTAAQLDELCLYLDSDGKITLGKRVSPLIKEAVEKLASL